MKSKWLQIYWFFIGISICLFFGYTRSWNESAPTDATVANEIDDYNVYLRVDVAERLEDWIGGFNADDSNEGFYTIPLIDREETPSTPATGKFSLYGKDVSSKCELFGIDEDGDEIQITSGGYINGAAILAASLAAGSYAADSIDSADYAAGSIDAEHLAADIIDETKIADDGIDSEHYNDGSVDAVHLANVDPDSVGAATVSVTFVNGLIVKFGTENVLANTTDDVTYGTAFPGNCLFAYCSYKDNAADISQACCVIPKSGSEDSILQVTNGRTSAADIYWLAIGY